MSRLRAFSLPRLTVAPSSKKQAGEQDHHPFTMSGAFNASSPYQFAPSHSRESSGASTSSTPGTPSSAARSSHAGGWPSSSSSLATTPDSPVNLTKSPLHDLVEDPEEREYGSFEQDDPFDRPSMDDPLCICDTPFCEHQQAGGARATIVASPTCLEWMPGDDDASCFESSPSSPCRTSRYRQSHDLSSESLVTRISRRWPSLSRPWKDSRPTTAISINSVRSAPPSRSSSLRLPNFKRSQLDSRNAMTPPYTPSESEYVEDIARPRACTSPLGITLPTVQDPIDRHEFASTPLLPPIFHDLRDRSTAEIQSPLQSPSIAAPSETTSAIHTPVSTAYVPGMSTPPLSSRPSVSSFGMPGSANLVSLSDVPAMSIAEDDKWAIKLGHANFHVLPEPYFPQRCDQQSCKLLLDDWESARTDYMRQAKQVKDSYGPTSHILKLTEQKWAEIDAVWRANHEMVNAEAGRSGETLVYQPLAATASPTELPSLNDPQQPAGKFPSIDEADIVGPMVQYAKVRRHPSSKKPSLLRIFTDPSSLLGRPTFNLRR